MLALLAGNPRVVVVDKIYLVLARLAAGHKMVNLALLVVAEPVAAAAMLTQ